MQNNQHHNILQTWKNVYIEKKKKLKLYNHFKVKLFWTIKGFVATMVLTYATSRISDRYYIVYVIVIILLCLDQIYPRHNYI